MVAPSPAWKAVSLRTDEQHVLCECPMTEHIHVQYNNVFCYPDILNNAENVNDFKFVYDVLDFFS